MGAILVDAQFKTASEMVVAVAETFGYAPPRDPVPPWWNDFWKWYVAAVSSHCEEGDDTISEDEGFSPAEAAHWAVNHVSQVMWWPKAAAEFNEIVMSGKCKIDDGFGIGLRLEAFEESPWDDD